MPDREAAQPDLAPRNGDRLLVFSAGRERYALPFNAIQEVIQTPPVVPVPLAPRALLGVSNLRGAVLPIADLAVMMGAEGAGLHADGKVLVLSGRAPIGLRIDDVHGTAGVNIFRNAKARGPAAETSVSAPTAPDQERPVQTLDVAEVLARNFEVGTAARAANYAHARHDSPSRSPERIDEDTLLTFDVAGQEFALPVACLVEVMPAASTSDGARRQTRGLVAFRGEVLPLFAMRALLGFEDTQLTGHRILIAKIAGAQVAMAVDRVTGIIRVQADSYEAVPSIIAQREAGDARIQSVIKREEGRKLVSVLSPDHLLGEDVMNRIRREAAASPQDDGGNAVAQRVLLVFELGGQEYGAAITAVEEVLNVPGQVTRLPHGPDFLLGVTNLRGAVLPVIDQRLRFGLRVTEGDGGRLLVMRIGAQLVGFIVDGVSEVLRVDETTISEAPTVLVGGAPVEGLLNLAEQGRMILLLDPALLLSTTERDLLEKLGT